MFIMVIETRGCFEKLDKAGNVKVRRVDERGSQSQERIREIRSQVSNSGNGAGGESVAQTDNDFRGRKKASFSGGEDRDASRSWLMRVEYSMWLGIEKDAKVPSTKRDRHKF